MWEINREKRSSTDLEIKIMKNKKHVLGRGFTLVELLTVIAIIGVLAGILIPVVGAARKSANKAKTRAQFNQWATALQNYRTEYGYWPPIGDWANATSDKTLDLSTKSTSEAFVQALTGRAITGTGAPSPLNLNRRQIPFYTFSESEWFYKNSGESEPGRVADAFGNPNICIAVDVDYDGRILKSAMTPAPAKALLDKVSGSYLGYRVAIWSIKPNNDTEGYEDVASWE